MGWLRQAGRRRWLAVGGSALALVLVLTGVSLAGVFPASGSGGQPAGRPGPGGSGGATARSSSPSPSASKSPRHDRTAAHAHHRRSGRTSCRSVAHIGDSTSVGMISPDLLPDPAQRMQAQYAHVGVRHSRVDASGGRSIVERMPGQANGYDVATNWDSHGYHGCWVIALGTNDTANVAVGSDVSRAARIDRMLAAAHGQPLLWVNVKSLQASGSWSESEMQLWNSALHRACARHSNLRIFNWAAVAHDSWFAPDGIHYSPQGYAARARMIARALARAFPSGDRSHGCFVRLGTAFLARLARCDMQLQGVSVT